MAHRNTYIGRNLNIVKNHIRYHRIKNHYSYQQLSNLLMLHGIDIHNQEIYKIEKGIRTVVDYEICRFMKEFDVSFLDLTSDFYDKI